MSGSCPVSEAVHSDSALGEHTIGEISFCIVIIFDSIAICRAMVSCHKIKPYTAARACRNGSIAVQELLLASWHYDVLDPFFWRGCIGKSVIEFDESLLGLMETPTAKPKIMQELAQHRRECTLPTTPVWCYFSFWEATQLTLTGCHKCKCWKEHFGRYVLPFKRTALVHLP